MPRLCSRFMQITTKYETTLFRSTAGRTSFDDLEEARVEFQQRKMQRTYCMLSDIHKIWCENA